FILTMIHVVVTPLISSHSYLLSCPPRRSSDLRDHAVAQAEEGNQLVEVQALRKVDHLSRRGLDGRAGTPPPREMVDLAESLNLEDRKSTRLNSSHQIISYAVFCLKKKKKQNER